VARRHADQARRALNGFSQSRYRAALLELTDFTVRRRF